MSGDGGSEAADLTGSAGHPCYANGTCNLGLTCVSQVCVDLDAGAGDAGTDGAGSSDAAAGDADASDASVALPPSCAPGGAGMTNCGAGKTESCCTSIEVEGGTFYRTYAYAADGGGPSGEADPATVSAFRLDKYDVTVGRFRQFVDAVRPSDGGAGWMPTVGSGKHAHLNGGSGLVNLAYGDAGTVYESGWSAAYASNVAPTDTNLQTSTYVAGPCTWTPSAGTQENLPINCVTWAEAYAFCIWDGGFLPSEAEWAYVAGAGSEEREYAWGETAPGTTNQYSIFSCNYPSSAGVCGGTGAVGTLANVAPVGTAMLGASKWGHLDLNGELAQFNLDYVGGGPSSPPYVSPCTDCTYELPGGLVRYGFRGGVYDGPNISSYLRNADWPARSFGIGFRCARTP